jgi:hypothetical protein
MTSTPEQAPVAIRIMTSVGPAVVTKQDVIREFSTPRQIRAYADFLNKVAKELENDQV